MEEETKPWTKEEIIKLLVVIGILLFLLLFSIFSGKGNNKEINKPHDYKEDLIEMFNIINDNYTLDINKVINYDVKHIEYITDGTLKLINFDDNDGGFLIYKDKTYYVESKNYKISEYNDNKDFLKDDYMNIDFIKSLINYCDVEQVNKNRIKCNINIKDYIDNYNVLNNTSYNYELDDKITFDIKYSLAINQINVDYSKIYNFINNTNDQVNYNIKINNINSNDYSKLFDIYSDTLKR